MTPDMQTIVTIFTLLAGGSGIAGIIVALSAKKKNKAEASGIIEDAASSLVEQYRKDNIAIRANYDDLKLSMEQCVLEIEELKKKLVRFEVKHGKLLDAIDRLVHQIKSLNHQPVCGANGVDFSE